MNTNFRDNIYNQDEEIRVLWTTLENVNTFGELSESYKKIITSYFLLFKDKEGWESVDHMIATIQAKIKLTGWNSSYAIKALNERTKQRYKRS